MSTRVDRHGLQRLLTEREAQLVARIVELLASADAVLAATGERVRACPRDGALRREVA
jgi:hypothetical protein